MNTQNAAGEAILNT